MLPRAIPVTRYCARSLVTPASWSWDVLPLPAVDGDHRHGTVVQPVVVLVAEVEDAGDPDEVLDLLDLIADLRGVVAGLLHGAEREVEGVLVADAVAVEDRDLEPEVGHVLGDGRRGRRGGPDLQAVGARAADL